MEKLLHVEALNELRKTLEKLFSGMSSEANFLISIGIIALAFIGCLLIMDFDFMTRFTKNVKKVTKYLNNVHFSNSEQVIEFTEQMKVLPKSVWREWQGYVEYNFGRPSEYISENFLNNRIVTAKPLSLLQNIATVFAVIFRAIFEIFQGGELSQMLFAPLIVALFGIILLFLVELLYYYRKKNAFKSFDNFLSILDEKLKREELSSAKALALVKEAPQEQVKEVREVMDEIEGIRKRGDLAEVERLAALLEKVPSEHRRHINDELARLLSELAIEPQESEKEE